MLSNKDILELNDSLQGTLFSRGVRYYVHFNYSLTFFSLVKGDISKLFTLCIGTIIALPFSIKYTKSGVNNRSLPT